MLLSWELFLSPVSRYFFQEKRQMSEKFLDFFPGKRQMSEGTGDVSMTEDTGELEEQKLQHKCNRIGEVRRDKDMEVFDGTNKALVLNLSQSGQDDSFEKGVV